jgi:hypothetical protein
MIALFRVAKSGWFCGPINVAAAMLFAVSMASMIAPGRLLLLEAPWGPFFRVEHALIWLATLAFIVYQAHLQGRSRCPPSPDRVGRAVGV